MNQFAGNILISVLCPVYNEKKYIENVMNFFINSQPVNKELLIIDGGSNDGTIDVVCEWSKKHSNIRFLHNPQKYVPHALNIGIKESHGNLIIRIDAHSFYSMDYFEKIIDTFEKTGADIVGGPTRIIVENEFDKAIQFVLKNPFGTGNSEVHDENFRGLADHVTFGAWRKELFSEIGYFDEALIRNQDDEFHYRANCLGKKVYLEPEIKLWYKPRQSFSALFKQYLQYGLYKPLVIWKTKKIIRIRYFIPAFFSLYLLLLPLLMIKVNLLFSIPLILYICLITLISFISSEKLTTKIKIIWIFVTIHTSYGMGFILGVSKLNKYS